MLVFKSLECLDIYNRLESTATKIAFSLSASARRPSTSTSILWCNREQEWYSSILYVSLSSVRRGHC